MIRCTHPTNGSRVTRFTSPGSREFRTKGKKERKERYENCPPLSSFLPGWQGDFQARVLGVSGVLEVLTYFFTANGSGKRLSGVSGSPRSLIGHTAALSIMYLVPTLSYDPYRIDPIRLAAFGF